MALVKCKECGKDVSTLATACPSCGAPPSGKAKLALTKKEVIVYKAGGNPGVMTGIFGCVFAVLGMLTLGVVFLPFAVLFTGVSLLQGILGMSFSGIATAIVSGILTMIGFAFSPAATLIALGIIAKIFAPGP